jgi:DNA-binding response OmpR family regulator
MELFADTFVKAPKQEAMSSFPEKNKYLVVEDDFALQTFWETIILSLDSKAIIRWSRSEEGAEKLLVDREVLGDPFDFVIVDVMLAGQKNGTDLWRKYKDKGLSFLFMSGLTERKFQKLLGEEKDDMQFFLKKPLDPVACLECLKALMAYRHLSVAR